MPIIVRFTFPTFEISNLNLDRKDVVSIIWWLVIAIFLEFYVDVIQLTAFNFIQNVRGECWAQEVFMHWMGVFK